MRSASQLLQAGGAGVDPGGALGPALADDVKSDLYRFADAARVENEHRAQVAGGARVLVPMPAATAVASDAR